jgi:iron complex outermembrane receptor protein
MNIEVTTASRMPRSRSRVPAAVHVITQEEIRRSGASTIPELLRLVPGVHAARIDANKWAIGIRGFTDRLARSMLVMIDGRAVYSPLFAGTYWEVQDYLIEDIERIEVIRGPGGTLWGANAVNGIINIITKEARFTQGFLTKLGGGSEENGKVAFRYGGRHRQDFFYRAYGKVFTRGPGFHADGRNFDDWRAGQAGFRTDWALAGNSSFTLHGDMYKNRAGGRSILTTYTPPFSSTIDEAADLSGGNILARWNRHLSGTDGFQLQLYYDRTNREEPTFQEKRDTVDLDFQHSFSPFLKQQFVWGFGYRASSGDTESVPTLQFQPKARTDNLFSVFLQDEIDLLRDRLRLTLGSKLEHNDYSGFELQPSARLLWIPAEEHTVILSVARAVRTPSRVERDLELTTLLNASIPLFLRLLPNDDFQAEKLIAYELGYRVRPWSRLYLSLSSFFNQHDDVLSTEVSPLFAEAAPAPLHLVLPLRFGNGLHGNSHGFELTSDLRATPWWRWSAAYSLLRVQLTRNPGSTDVSQEVRGEGISPRHQIEWQSYVNLPRGLELDWLFRYVSKLPALAVPGYATSDVRLGWRPNRTVELAVIGKNLHQARHLEFSGGSSGNTQVRRRVYGEVTLRW